MKKMRKIVPAFAMLMVAAIMMSTASFAWFSMNTEASATGMNIKAKSDGGLAIATWTQSGAPLDAAYKSSVQVDWTNGATLVAPTSHNGTTWFYASSASVDNYEAVVETETDDNGDTVAVDTYKTVTEGAAYYLMSKWNIKTLSEGQAADVKLAGITVSGIGSDAGNAELAKALRIAIHSVEEDAWYYFAPQYAAGNSTSLSHVVDANTAGNYTATGIACGTNPNVVVLNDVSATPETIEVYIYFEGEDENCVSANAINLKTITVDLTFATDGAFTNVTTPSAPAETTTPAESEAVENESTEG